MARPSALCTPRPRRWTQTPSVASATTLPGPTVPGAIFFWCLRTTLVSISAVTSSRRIEVDAHQSGRRKWPVRQLCSVLRSVTSRSAAITATAAASSVVSAHTQRSCSWTPYTVTTRARENGEWVSRTVTRWCQVCVSVSHTHWWERALIGGSAGWLCAGVALPAGGIGAAAAGAGCSALFGAISS